MEGLFMAKIIVNKVSEQVALGVHQVMIGFEHCDNVKRYLKFKASFRQVIPIKPLSRFTIKKFLF